MNGSLGQARVQRLEPGRPSGFAIEQLVPQDVVLVESRRDFADARLSPEEERVVEGAVGKRRREFATSRLCARYALQRLGADPVSIPRGQKGEPLWPDGVVGSITHCRGLRACAVAWRRDVASVGIDAEPHEPLPAGVLSSVASDVEQARLFGRAAGVCMDRVLFSAKEAIYKAWYPLAKRRLGFEDVEMEIDVGGSFSAKLLVEGPVVGGQQLREFHGRWNARDDIVGTAVVVASG